MNTENPAEDTHRQTWEELAWLANGSASPQQRDRAQTHLAHCECCQEELQRQQLLRQEMQRPAPQERQPDPEAGLARLLAQLPAQAGRDDAQTAGAAPARSLRPWRMSWLGAVALAQAAAIGVLALGLVAQERDPAEPRNPGIPTAAGHGDKARLRVLVAHERDAADYRSLSTPPAANPSERARWRVLPAEDMSLREWRALLAAHQLQVTAGPNSAGAWELGSLDTQVNDALVLSRLRQQPRLRLVEPLQQP